MPYQQKIACKLISMLVASTSFLTLLICLQSNDNDFWGGDISKYVLCVPDKTSNFSMLISLRKLPSIPRAMEKLL